MQSRRTFLTTSAFLGLGALSACSKEELDGTDSESSKPTVDTSKYASLSVDMSSWGYDETNDVWYKLCVQNCLTPASPTYECLSIFVPGPYMTGKKNGSTWSCSIVEDAVVGLWNAKSAPVIFGINAPGFGAQAPSSTYVYDGLGQFLDSGCVYVFPGMRGRTSGYEKINGGDSFFAGGAPWAVADLKACCLWYRYNDASIPGDVSKIYAFGLGAGGGLACILGATGDAPEYSEYLDSIGAARWDSSGTILSDSVRGICVWNPLVNLGTDDAAYEWLYGQYASDASRSDGSWTKHLSECLTDAWAQDLNESLLVQDDVELQLDETTGSGRYSDGTYYEYLLNMLETSANKFFETVQFPFTIAYEVLVDPGFPGGLKTANDVEAGLLDSLLEHAKLVAGEESDEVKALEGEVVDETFETVQSYVSSLNAEDENWFTYNEKKNTARISSIAGYVQNYAPATRPCTAYDVVECNSVENQLFGVVDDSTLHYSKQIASVLSAEDNSFDEAEGWSGSYLARWNYDLTVKDELGNSVFKRLNMYDPMFYLINQNSGYGSSRVAREWRINVGLQQSVIPAVSGINLALAASKYSGVKRADLTCAWDKGMTMAEISGSPIANALNWIEDSNSEDGQ